jgi:rhodanese-related sulfurtransferase
MTRKLVKLIVLLTTLVSIGVSADIQTRQEISSAAKAKAPHVTAQQLAADLSRGEEFLLLDVRTEAEFDAGHIQGAKWLPRGKLEFHIQDLTTDPASRIVLYCGSGARSALATLTLQGMGYQNVTDLEGGFEQWLADGHSVQNRYGEMKAVAKPE